MRSTLTMALVTLTVLACFSMPAQAGVRIGIGLPLYIGPGYYPGYYHPGYYPYYSFFRWSSNRAGGSATGSSSSTSPCCHHLQVGDHGTATGH